MTISSPSAEVPIPPRVRTLRYAVPVGRVLFAAAFVMTSLVHFTPDAIAWAASQGVPIPEVLVPLSGLIALVGGLCVMLGTKVRFGAALLVLFLVPVTLIMHRFWEIGDAHSAMIQRAMFLKNLSMLGGAILLLYFGAGPLSFDTRQPRGPRET